MSIGKRFINLARTELNSLLDRAARSSEDSGESDPDSDLYEKYGVSALTDEELEAELERRRRARETAARASQPRTEAPPRTSESQSRTHRSSDSRTPSAPDTIRRAYAALEVPPGSNFETVRRSYRTLMRKYHPDRHTQTPEKQKTANELAQKLTEAYKTLEKHLRK